MTLVLQNLARWLVFQLAGESPASEVTPASITIYEGKQEGRG